MAKLTASMVARLRTPGKYLDGHGLMLRVVTADQRYWTFRFKRDGRDRMLSLGNADVVTLSEARKRHTEARVLLARGLDPRDERDRAREKAKPQVTFSEAAQAYIKAHAPGLREASVAHWQRSMGYVQFGHKAVGEVTVDDVLRCLTPLWAERTATASNVRSRIELILDYAKGRKWRSPDAANPATWRGNLRSLLPAPRKVHQIEHHAALEWASAPALMRRFADETNMACRCLRFLVLTATRSGEARGCRWSEIDMANAVWTLPASRMKAAKEHRVPLSDAAMTILHQLAEIRTGDLVFPGRFGDAPLADVSLKHQLRRLGHDDITVHGFRSTFRDWCAEMGKPGDVAEQCLAHQVGSAVERAYRRSDVLDRRRVLMTQWAEFLTKPPAQVITMPAARSR
jgi:integrase